MHNTPLPAINERNLILIVGLIQFVNVLDFMMVMPLGPDFAKALGIPTSDIGLIGGSYTFAAAFSGLVAALFLDLFARKKAVLFCLIGLTLATLAGAFVWSKESMLAARVMAGIFGGPLTSLGIALVADYIPPERRGAAMGKVMGGFAAASVIGVPFGLELASRVSWHAPFVATAALGAVIFCITFALLPYHKPYHAMSPLKHRVLELARMLQSPLALMSYAFTGLAMMASFMIIPNISAHLQLNLHYPREHIGILYFCGGAVSFFSMRIAGWMVDRTSASRTVLLTTATLIFTITFGFITYPSSIPIVILFILFMVSTSGGRVCAQTLSSKIPNPRERGAYMSVQSAITHFSSAVGAYYSSRVLVEVDGALLHMAQVGISAAILSAIVPILFFMVERRLKRAQ